MKEKPTRILATYFIYTCISQASRSNKKRNSGGECRDRTCKTLFNVYGLAIRCNTIIRTHRIVNGGR